MRLKGLHISTVRLQEVLSRASTPASSKTSNGGRRSGGRSTDEARVSQAIIAETGTRYPDCTCEEDDRVGLHAGMTIEELQHLGSGCCDSRFRMHGGWVCPRLDAIRRAYGR